ncbi:MAG: CHASE2 domain-containing protein [Chryseolinea sp.]
MGKGRWFCLLLVCFFSCKERYPSNNVIIVDIGDLGRAGIGQQVAIINSLAPKVLLIDVKFLKTKEREGDSLLANALNHAKNLVMVSEIEGFENGSSTRGTLLTSHRQFIANAKTGFANAVVDDQKGTISRFCVSQLVEEKIEYHVGVMAALAFDSVKAYSFLQKADHIIEIDFVGDLNAFSVVKVNELFEGRFNKDDFRDKIVIVGSFNSVVDRDIFRIKCPSNRKCIPYMPGVVIVANIIERVLQE